MENYRLKLWREFDGLNFLQTKLAVWTSNDSRVGWQVLISSHLRRSPTAKRHGCRRDDLWRNLLLLLLLQQLLLWLMWHSRKKVWSFVLRQVDPGRERTAGIRKIRILGRRKASHQKWRLQRDDKNFMGQFNNQNQNLEGTSLGQGSQTRGPPDVLVRPVTSSKLLKWWSVKIIYVILGVQRAYEVKLPSRSFTT